MILADWISFKLDYSALYRCAVNSCSPVTASLCGFPQPARFDNHPLSRISAKNQVEFSELFLIRLASCLGLSFGTSRGRGYLGYTHSHDLYVVDSVSGESHLAGICAFGGESQRGTIYFSVTGAGCSFAYNTAKKLKSLHKFLQWSGCKYLNRLDLAFDDFEGLLDRDYITNQYNSGAFYRGGCPPSYELKQKKRGSRVVGETVYIGSRSSTVFFRGYDKALQSGVFSGHWYRAEFELKKVPIDSLLNLDSSFASINKFSEDLLDLAHFEKIDIAQVSRKRTQKSIEKQISYASRIASPWLLSLKKYSKNWDQVLAVFLNEKSVTKVIKTDSADLYRFFADASLYSSMFDDSLINYN